MTDISEAISSTFSNPTELYFHTDNLTGDTDGWQHVDTMSFLLKMKIERDIGFYEYWIPRQEKRVDQARYWANRHQASYVPKNEISENNWKGSVAKAKSEQFNLLVLKSELDAAQALYLENVGQPYTTIKANLIDEEASDEIKALMADMEALNAA